MARMIRTLTIPVLSVLGLTAMLLVLLSNTVRIVEVADSETYKPVVKVIYERSESQEEIEIPAETEQIETEQYIEDELECLTEEEPTVYYPLTEYEFDYAVMLVSQEAYTADYTSHALVAQCLLQHCIDYGCQPSQCEAFTLIPTLECRYEETAVEAVKNVFYDGILPCEYSIKYYYAPGVEYSAWHESQNYILTYGGHRFFTERY